MYAYRNPCFPLFSLLLLNKFRAKENWTESFIRDVGAGDNVGPRFGGQRAFKWNIVCQIYMFLWRFSVTDGRDVVQELNESSHGGKTFEEIWDLKRRIDLNPSQLEWNLFITFTVEFVAVRHRLKLWVRIQNGVSPAPSRETSFRSQTLNSTEREEVFCHISGSDE